MDVDFEFTVARLAKIANNNSFVGLLGNLVRLGEFVRDNPFPACAFSTLNAVSRSSRQKGHKRDIRCAEPVAHQLLLSSSNRQHRQVPTR